MKQKVSLYFSLLGVSTIIAGALAWLFRRFYMDDAFIGFRYAENLRDFNEVSYHLGERVEGITNIGWVLLLSLFENIPMAAKILGAVSMAIVVLLCVIGYATRAKIFDYCFGLLHKDVTDLMVNNEQHCILPNDPRMRDLWGAYQPDYILEDDPIMAELGGRQEGDQFVVHEIRYSVVRRFTIGENRAWVFAERIK
jgi:hypothetical protein